MRIKYLLLIFCIILGSVAFTSAATAIGRDKLIFSHQTHSIDHKIECVKCHGNVLKPEIEKKVIPTKKVCGTCHAEEVEGKGEKGCDLCHTKPKSAKAIPEPDYHLKFYHKRHVEVSGLECDGCHKEVAKAGRASKSRIPKMAVCMECHQDEYDNLECSSCHEDLYRYRLKPLAGFSHKGNWIRQHRSIARTHTDECAQCHPDSYCNDCHNQYEEIRPSIKYSTDVERNFIHRGDWITRHAMETRVNAGTCQKCHETKYCRECHKRNNLTFDSGVFFNPHPPGWVNNPASPNFHGYSARRDITSCASCHEGDRPNVRSNCVQCHATGRRGGSPHPPGWKSNQPITDTVCRRCHIPMR